MTIALGLVVAGIGTVLMLANAGTFTAAPDGTGYDFVPRQDGYFWTTVAMIVVGSIVAVAGAIAQFAAWIAAIVNSYHLVDRTWFVLTLVLGLVGFGLVVMILYLILAPDSYEETMQRAGRPVTPGSFAPSH